MSLIMDEARNVNLHLHCKVPFLAKQEKQFSLVFQFEDILFKCVKDTQIQLTFTFRIYCVYT